MSEPVQQTPRPRGRPKKVVVEMPAPKKPGRPKKLSIAEKEERAALRESELAAAQPTKKRGKPRNENYLPFEEARNVVRAEMLHSRSAFEHWWDREKPKTIPRFPYRVYTQEWVTWNDFLGTNNEFKKGVKSWRPMNEAVVYVHSLQLKTQRDWLDYCRDHADSVPDDIPRRPDVVYDKWVSWNHWLGNKPVEAVQAKVEAAKVAVYYIVHEQGVPGNVFTYGVEKAGISALKDWWDRDKYDVIAFFWYEPERANDIQQLVEVLSSPYLGENRQRITPNVWQIVEILQTMLCTIPSAQLRR